jgi:hypothetical protein
MNAILPMRTRQAPATAPHHSGLGYIFPLPSPYTPAQQNWLTHKMWSDAADRATKYGQIHHRAMAEMAKLSLLPMQRCEELTLPEWKVWRAACQQVNAVQQSRPAGE